MRASVSVVSPCSLAGHTCSLFWEFKVRHWLQSTPPTRHCDGKCAFVLAAQRAGHKTKSKWELEVAARALATAAIDNGSTDNVSVLLVLLRPPKG